MPWRAAVGRPRRIGKKTAALGEQRPGASSVWSARQLHLLCTRGNYARSFVGQAGQPVILDAARTAGSCSAGPGSTTGSSTEASVGTARLGTTGAIPVEPPGADRISEGRLETGGRNLFDITGGSLLEA